MNDTDSLRLELEAEKHNHKKDNEYLLQRIHMLEVALQMIDNLLDHELTEIARKNAQEIIRHALRPWEPNQ